MIPSAFARSPFLRISRHRLPGQTGQVRGFSGFPRENEPAHARFGERPIPGLRPRQFAPRSGKVTLDHQPQIAAHHQRQRQVRFERERPAERLPDRRHEPGLVSILLAYGRNRASASRAHARANPDPAPRPSHSASPLRPRSRTRAPAARARAGTLRRLRNSESAPAPDAGSVRGASHSTTARATSSCSAKTSAVSRSKLPRLSVTPSAVRVSRTLTRTR
jgi:hypothetical protein